jgi:hypothetical protein
MRQITRVLSIVGAFVMAAAVSTMGAKEANALCPNSIDPNGANCLASGGNIIDFDELNLAIGFINGSGTSNHVFGGGPEIDINTLNAWFGVANGSGNANIIFSAPSQIGSPTVNVAALNFEAGIANGSGNANILLADDPCVVDPNAPGGTNCSGADAAVNIQVGNTYHGILNGSLNGNNIGTGSATSIDIENFANGLGNLSANGNVVGNCRFTRFDDPTFEGGANDPDFPVAGAGQSSADNGTGRLICNQTGDAKSVNINNTAFGNLNGAGNGNALGGLQGGSATAGDAKSIMINNRLFGDLNASGNGNAFGDGENGLAVIKNNFISGNGSGTANGNGSSGKATWATAR